MCTQSHVDKVEMVQRRAARWIKFDSGSASIVTDMLHSLNLRRLDLRRIYSRLSLFYKIHHNLVVIPIDCYLNQLTASPVMVILAVHLCDDRDMCSMDTFSCSFKFKNLKLFLTFQSYITPH